jgi:ribosomal protein S18 acetylase RimI-like enzyme
MRPKAREGRAPSGVQLSLLMAMSGDTLSHLHAPDERGHWRLARPDDGPSIIAMCLRLYEEDPSPLRVDAEGVQRTLEVLARQPERGRAVVLEQGGRLLGYALLVSYWSNERGGEMCFVDELFVDRQARGRGHATALIEELAREGTPLWPAGSVALALEVTPTNARAQALYSRLGFVAAKNTTMVRLKGR